jgi:hypothetical protein
MDRRFVSLVLAVGFILLAQVLCFGQKVKDAKAPLDSLVVVAPELRVVETN